MAHTSSFEVSLIGIIINDDDHSVVILLTVHNFSDSTDKLDSHCAVLTKDQNTRSWTVIMLS